MTQTIEPQTCCTPAAATPARGTRAFAAPEVDIFETKDGYVLKAEMPGVNKAGLEITVEDRDLTIIGRRNDGERQAEPIHRESRPLDYRRAFELDPTIDTGRISAKIEQGLLTLHLPKQERVKPRTIHVND
jgi:HSP20 family protein